MELPGPPTLGQVYESRRDVPISVGILYKAAGSGGAEGILPKGEKILITSKPPSGAQAIQALPLNYGMLEKQLVPSKELTSPSYQSYGISVLLDYLYRHFSRLDYAGVEFDDPRATETWQLIKKHSFIK